MSNKQRRLVREQQTIEAMIDIYCADQHIGSNGLCPTCEALRSYAQNRLDRCPYLPDKPTCLQCLTHCYKAEMREQIRTVMRYAGPKMIWRHPRLALWHLWDERQYSRSKELQTKQK